MTAMIQANRTYSVHLLYISETFLSESLGVKGEEYRFIVVRSKRFDEKNFQSLYNFLRMLWCIWRMLWCSCCGVYQESRLSGRRCGGRPGPQIRECSAGQSLGQEHMRLTSLLSGPYNAQRKCRLEPLDLAINQRQYFLTDMAVKWNSADYWEEVHLKWKTI